MGYGRGMGFFAEFLGNQLGGPENLWGFTEYGLSQWWVMTELTVLMPCLWSHSTLLEQWRGRGRQSAWVGPGGSWGTCQMWSGCLHILFWVFVFDRMRMRGRCAMRNVKKSACNTINLDISEPISLHRVAEFLGDDKSCRKNSVVYAPHPPIPKVPF